MVQRLTNLYYLFPFIVLFYSCTSNNKQEQTVEEIDSVKLAQKINATRDFFYNILLPCDLIYSFKLDEIEFNAEWINPANNYINYGTSNKKAINLGIYGVDFGYCNLNDEIQYLKEYSKVIAKLSKELGIPEEHITSAMELSTNLTSKDSLYNVTCNLYDITDSYLNKNDRESVSALIILGGWIEAMYIITNLAEQNPSYDALKKVGTQKYALQSLISYLSAFQDDMLISNYLVLLNAMNKTYEQIEIYYADTSLNLINKETRTINTNASDIVMNQEQLIKIKSIVGKIRIHMVK